MAYNFAGITTRYLDSSPPNISAYPSTISYWARLTDLSAASQIFSWHIWNTSSNYVQIRVLVTNTSVARAAIIDPLIGGTNADSTSTLVTNTWYHICAVLDSSTSRTVYLNGGNSGNNTVNITPTGMNTIYIGNSVTPAGGVPTNSPTRGSVGDVGIWSAALGVDEINSLAKGFSAKRIRPQSLEYYVPLVRNLYEYNSNIILTNNGNTPTSDHNRIYI